MAAGNKSPAATLRLNDGVEMPIIGFGTSGIKWADLDQDESVYEAVRHAIKCGYRFFDTAELYLNEASVGRAIADAIGDGEVKRREVFVCSKVWNTHHETGSVIQACQNSVDRLGLDFIDLYLIHWPTAYQEAQEEDDNGELLINPKDDEGKLIYGDTPIIETWLGMEEVVSMGLARSIGLSNFNHLMIDEILDSSLTSLKPSVLQVECHPYLAQEKLADYCRERDIVLNAYCPLGAPGADWPDAADKPRLLDDGLIGELALKHGKTPAQIILRYHIQRGIVPIPKSSSPLRVAENIDVFDFELSQEEMQQLMGLDGNVRYCLNTAGEYIDDHKLYPFHAEY